MDDEQKTSARDVHRALRLLERGADADYEIDLSGLDLAHALASIDQMIERQRFREAERQVRVRLDPATARSGETLFQPVGRHLLGLMKRELVLRCTPLAGDAGSGFLLVLPGRGEDDEDV